MTRIAGLSAFPITPMDEAGRVDLAALGGLVRRLVEAGVDSIGLLGSTGSYPYLTRAERRRATEHAVAIVGGRVPVLVGVGALRTDEAVRLAQDARAAGADAGLLAPVSYTPLTDDEVCEHVAAVAGASALPLCLYNNPSTTHFTFTPAVVGRLARLPTVVAVKNPAPDAAGIAAYHAAMREAAPEPFSLGYSVDWHAAEALIAGGEAWYSVAGGLFPAPCVAITAAIRRGDAAEARRLDAALAPLWDLFRRHSSLRVMYAAATALGLVRSAPPRPILPLAPEAEADVTRVLAALGLE